MSTNIAAPSWITGPRPRSAKEFRALYLRRGLLLEKTVKAARARVSALGWYRFFVSGADMTGPALVPRWTPFDRYVEYQEYDVTEALVRGINVLAMAIGDGRFRGRNGAINHRAVYGDRLAGWVQVEIDYADGTREVVDSNEDWSAGTGRIIESDPKFGEAVDLRISDSDWLTSDVAPPRFGAVEVLPQPRPMIPEDAPRVQEVTRLSPTSITRAPSGRQLVDFGQNAAGVVRIRLSGPVGTQVVLTYSEVAGEDGEIDTKYLALLPVGKGWSQTDRVTLDGGEHWWQPWFTIHGFRFVEVAGLGYDLGPDDIEYVVLSTALHEEGAFVCSHSGLSKLYENVRWSLRSNFTDTPTDCPTRERSGWTGDLQTFAATAAVYADVFDYLRRYLRNLAAEQLEDGRVPVFIPSESSSFSGGMSWPFRYFAQATGWGDAAVLVPWDLYTYYGDRTVLEEAYPAAVKWVTFLMSRAARRCKGKSRGRGAVSPHLEEYIVDSGFDFGEWLRPGETFPGSMIDALTRSGPVVATAYLEHSCRLMSRIADVLGKADDAAHYECRADLVRQAWREAFVGAGGRVGLDRQDDYVRALSFGLLDTHEKNQALTRLTQLIDAADHHLGTGFLSTGMLMHVLADHGREDIAYRILLQDTSPSWLYQVKQGATTTWEKWEGCDRKGNPTASQNHYSFGTVARFLVERLAGIAPSEPGYRRIDLRPGLGSGLDSASATVGTPHGTASISWRKQFAEVEIGAFVPEGTSARLHVAGSSTQELPCGTHTIKVPLPSSY